MHQENIVTQHLVIGAGGIGRAAARHLVAREQQVTIGTRSGSDPGIPGVRAVQVDASDADALTRLAQGAATLVNAVNPAKYYRWVQDWPPVAAAMLAAAQS